MNKLSKLDYIFATFIFLTTSIFYLLLAANSVQESDGAEYALMALVDAPLHPPGYPLYAMITRFLVYLFPNNPYATLANFSAVCQAASMSLLFIIARRVRVELLLSLSMTIALAIFYPNLRVAADAEVFALQNLLLAIFLYFCFSENNLRAKKFLIGLSFGLAASNHHTIILWVPLIFVFAISSDVQAQPKSIELKFKNIFQLLLGFLLGLSPYMYYLKFIGQIHQGYFALNNFSDVWDYFFRVGYGTLNLKTIGGEETSYLLDCLSVFSIWLPFLLICTIFYFVEALRERKLLSLSLVLTIVAHFWFVTKLNFEGDINFHRTLIARFYSVLAWLPIVLTFYFLNSYSQKNTFFKFLAVFLLLLPPLTVFKQSLAMSNFAADRTVDLELTEIVESLPANSVYISNLDRHSSGVRYKQAMDYLNLSNNRLIVYGMLGHKFYREKIKQDFRLEKIDTQQTAEKFLEQLLEELQNRNKSVFAYPNIKLPEDYNFYPAGIVWEVLSSKVQVEREDLLKNILGYCGRIRADLADISEARVTSLLIRDRVFASPFKISAASFSDSLIGNQLAKIGSLITEGEISEAQNLCRQTVRALKIKPSKKINSYLKSDLKKNQAWAGLNLEYPASRTAKS